VAAADVVVRPATQDDRDAYRASFEEVAREGRWLASELPVDWSIRTPWEELLASPRSHVLVADDGGRIVGGLGIDLSRFGRAELGMHLVDGYRAAGIGARLLASAIDWARSAGAHKVVLELFPSNERARRLYERHGFVVEGRHRRHWRRNDGSLADTLFMGLVLDETAPGCPF
jgi:RimJ/RimL family protein N-acetyltransferase